MRADTKKSIRATGKKSVDFYLKESETFVFHDAAFLVDEM